MRVLDDGHKIPHPIFLLFISLLEERMQGTTLPPPLSRSQQQQQQQRRPQSHAPLPSSPFDASNRSPCSWASGCCQRHPISCRDTSRLFLAPAPTSTDQCVGAPVYTRPGRVGSKYTTQYLSDHGGQRCAQWGAFHDVLASALPAHQNKVTVLREPCSRAHSLLSHWHREFPPAHGIQRVRTLAQLAFYLRTNWERVMRRPWPEHDTQLHHFIVGWPQAWYVDGCTRVLCFERVSDELSAFCSARRTGGTHPGLGTRHLAVLNATAAAAAAAAATAAAAAEAGCAEIRDIYAADSALYDHHCRRPTHHLRGPVVPATAVPAATHRNFMQAHEATAPSANGTPSATVPIDATMTPKAPYGTDTGSGTGSGVSRGAEAATAPLDALVSSGSTSADCGKRIAVLMMGLAGPAPQAHMRAAAALHQQLSADAIAVGEAHEVETGLASLSLLGRALGALGVVSAVAHMPRPAYLPPTTLFKVLSATSPGVAAAPAARRRLSVVSPSQVRRSAARRSPAATRTSSSSNLRQGAKAQWLKYAHAWRLMAQVEASRSAPPLPSVGSRGHAGVDLGRHDGAWKFDVVLKLRFDATPLPPFHPCAAFRTQEAAGAAGISEAGDAGDPVVFAATDKIFWGRRDAMALLAGLHDAIPRAFEQATQQQGQPQPQPQPQPRGGVPPPQPRGGVPPPRLLLDRLLESAAAVPVDAWSTTRELRQHYNKVAMLPVPTLTTEGAGYDAAPPGWSDASVRARTLGKLRAARSEGVKVVAPYSTLAAATNAGVTFGTEAAGGIGGLYARLTHGPRSSPLDRDPHTFVAERDFLLWLLWHNATVCDLGARTTRILYKGATAPRPSVPCAVLQL